MTCAVSRSGESDLGHLDNCLDRRSAGGLVHRLTVDRERASLADMGNEKRSDAAMEISDQAKDRFDARASLWSTYDERSPLDHAEADREPHRLAELWKESAARLLKITSDGQTCGLKSATSPLESLNQESDFNIAQEAGVVFLGKVDDQPWFAVRDDLAAKSCAHLQNIRTPDLDDLSRHLLVTAHAILNWREATQFCSRCGASLRPIKGGFAADCPSCQRQHFPRTDPAIIVAVLNERDELYLAHQSTWPATRMSLLAGFVEAGESLVAACHREIAEEASLELSSVRYLSSQPWPFPRSLMVGFVARSVGGFAGGDAAGHVDGVELDRGAFFSRADVDQQLGTGELSLPGPGSIAHRIIAAWRADKLLDPDQSPAT